MMLRGFAAAVKKHLELLEKKEGSLIIELYQPPARFH
jgi:hypothetical protein